jgi:hypothetical protein
MPYRTGYGSTDRSGDARRGQAASAASGDSGPHHREAQDRAVREPRERTSMRKRGKRKIGSDVWLT